MLPVEAAIARKTNQLSSNSLNIRMTKQGSLFW
jgi:hypothetical protein